MLNLDFSPFPVIETRRLLLREMTTADCDALFAIRSHPLVNQYLERADYTRAEEAFAFIEKIKNNTRNNVAIFWGIQFKENPKLIGGVCLWNISTVEERAETGFELHPDHWNKGIISEALEQAVHYGFNTMNLKAIDGWAHKDNLASQKLMEKQGFTRNPEAEEKFREQLVDLVILTRYKD
jgi:[ribosomal protein S5]-alanine N-acetyltransferase